MQQKRLLLALLLSCGILFLWTYFYPVPTQNQKQGTTPSPTASPSATQTSTSANQTAPTAAPPAPNVSAAPQRTITVRTPLYDAKFDTLGAEAVSWILKVNKNNNNEIFSVGADRKQRKPLELISAEGLKHQPRMAPLQLQTGDAGLDAALSSSTYKVEGVDQASGDVEVNLGRDDKKELTFVYEDANRNQVRKKIVFDGNHYETELSLLVKRGDQTVPQVKLAIGPSIGDQGVPHHTFYSVAPEGVAYVNNKLERHPPAGINTNKNDPDHLALNGPVDWAAVADTYFAMVAVPNNKTEGLEYRTVAYEYKPERGSAEKRFLVTAFVPVAADGSRTVIYTGPKDHDLLTQGSEVVSGLVGRSVDLEGMIDYGWLGWISRPLAVPILRAITKLFEITHSYGIAIILFTIGIYSLFFPLKLRSSKAMKKAQKLAPKMKELQEKMKGMKQNDPRMKELQMDQLRLMKEGNPLGGCLPLLIQMPFLFALFRAITISLDFRQASFLWIPDLSAAEPYMIHILPLLMTGTMVILQMVTPAPSTDPMQKKMMAFGMPLFMLYFLWSAPSGLVLYWLVGNIVGFSQQFLINRWTKTDDEVPEPPPAKGPPGPKKKLNAPATTRLLKD